MFTSPCFLSHFVILQHWPRESKQEGCMVKSEGKEPSRKLTAENSFAISGSFASPSMSQIREWESVQGAPGSHL